MEAERAAERDHHLPGAQVVGIAERQRRQAGRLDLDDGEIRLEIDADDAGVQDPAARPRIEPPVGTLGTSTRIRCAPRTTCALVTM